MLRTMAMVAILSSGLCGQETSSPLESVTVGGTMLSKETVLQLMGLRVGDPVDKQAIERWM
jgi:hypothetical protein